MSAKKRTAVMTNSPSIQLLLREAQCRLENSRVPFLDGRAGPCQTYPEKFCRLVYEGVKRDIENLQWRDEKAKVFVFTQPFGKLMAIQQEAERPQSLEQTDPPEEDYFEQIYDGNFMEFIDDVSGEPLERADAIAARKVEIKYFKDMGVYTKIKRQSWMTVISRTSG